MGALEGQGPGFEGASLHPYISPDTVLKAPHLSCRTSDATV